MKEGCLLALDLLVVGGWRARVVLLVVCRSGLVGLVLVAMAVTVAAVSVVIASAESAVEELSGQEEEAATDFDLLVVLLEEVEGLVSVLRQEADARRELVDELREVVRRQQEGDAQEAQQQNVELLVLKEAQSQGQRSERHDEVERHVVRKPLDESCRLNDPVARIDLISDVVIVVMLVVMMVMMVMVVVVVMVDG